MSLETPTKIRMLQRKLYQKAKEEPDYRFYLLYDKMYREDILNHAYALAKSNQGAPGVDGQSFTGIEAAGLGEWLNGIRNDLRAKTYTPQAVRRVKIPKPGGGERPLGIPTASANCTGAQIAFRMGGDPPSVSSTSRAALSGFEGTPDSRH
jgi:RNA-directed DNA polymerase